MGNSDERDEHPIWQWIRIQRNGPVIRQHMIESARSSLAASGVEVTPEEAEQWAAEVDAEMASDAMALRADLALMTDARDIAAQCARIEADRAQALHDECERLRERVAILEGERR